MKVSSLKMTEKEMEDAEKLFDEISIGEEIEVEQYQSMDD